MIKMENIMSCPVCTLYLRPGMSMEQHLNTHPKDLIISMFMKTTGLVAPVTPSPAPQLFQQPSPIPQPQQPPTPIITNQHPPPINNTVKKENTPNIFYESPSNGNLTPGNYRVHHITLDQLPMTQMTTSPSPTTVVQSQSPSTGPIRCIQNTEKNIMIVNTSSTQFIQQTIPSPTQLPTRQKITLYPHYTSEKYSGPPPPYSTAISNISSSATTSRNAIDLTQSENPQKQQQQQARQMIIASTPKKFVEFRENENGEFIMCTASTSGQQEDVGNASGHADNDDTEIEEVNFGNEYDQGGFNYVEEVEVPMEYRNAEIYDNDTVEDEMQFELADNSGKEQQSSVNNNESTVKVLSNVKVTQSDLIPPNIKDMWFSKSKKEEPEEMEEMDHPSDGNENDEPAVIQEEEPEKLADVVETINLDENATTSVIRKTPNELRVASPQPSTSSQAMSSSSSSMQIPTRRNSSNFIFNSNRLKSKQPKKLVLKLKKPLVVDEEQQVEKPDETTSVKSEMPEITVEKEEISQQLSSVQENVENSSVEVEEKIEEEVVSPVPNNGDQFTVTYLESDITIEPETKHVQSDPNFDSSNVKNENCDKVVIKTEKQFPSKASTDETNDDDEDDEECTAGPSTSSNNLDESIMICDNSSLAIATTSQSSERYRFSPPLSPVVYIHSFSHSQSGTGSQEAPTSDKKETDDNWNNNLIINGSTATTASTNNYTRYMPSFIYEDNRSSYTDLDACNRTNSSSSSSAISGNSNGELSNSQKRTVSLDGLNIRTDEKMPARGEISEQESNGDMEQPWHQFYPLQAYPSSYDLSTAQECWNLSKHDSQNACDSNSVQNVILNFPPLNQNQNEDIKTPDILNRIIVTKSNDSRSDNSNLSDASGQKQAKIVKPRTYRCPSCFRVFSQLKERRQHLIQAHNHPTGKITTSTKTSTITSTQTSKSLLNPEQPMTSTSSSSAFFHKETTATPDLSVVKTETVTNNSAIVTVKNEMNRIIMNYTMLKQELECDVKPLMGLTLDTPSTSQLAIPSTSTMPLGIKIKRTYVCATCKEEFRTLRLFDKHLRIHPAECVACGKSFHNWVNFSIHLKRHLNIKNHLCRFCPKRFVIRQKLVEHMRIHTNSAPLKCMYCPDRFRRYSNLIQHRNRVHLNKKPSRKDYVCDCGEIFPSKAKLEWHQETHENRPKACPHCRERFTHRNSLTRHIRLSHADKYQFDNGKTVQCPVCQATYLASSIKAHMITHSVDKKEFCCSICNKGFSTKWNLKQHNWTHASRSSKPFQCNVCPSAFIRESDFITHMNAHKSIKPYTCNHCGCQFVRKYNWLRHTREHEKEKRYTCTVCNKKFHRAYYLTEHKRVHSGERPFGCNICGKRSATKTNHNKHIKIHHARDPLTAEG